MDNEETKWVEAALRLVPVARNRVFPVVLYSEIRDRIPEEHFDEAKILIENAGSKGAYVENFGGLKWDELANLLCELNDCLEWKNPISGKNFYDEVIEFGRNHPGEDYHFEWDDDLEELFGEYVKTENEYRFIENHIITQIILECAYEWVPNAYGFRWYYENDDKKMVLKDCYQSPNEYINYDRDEIDEEKFFQLVEMLETIARKNGNVMSTKRMRFYLRSEHLSSEQINVFIDALKQRGIQINKTYNSIPYDRTRAYLSAIEAADVDLFKENDWQ